MNVLSLFDGISCGYLAFQRANIPITEYHACEIDKFAIKISINNYPNIIRHGSVIDYHPDRHFDYLIGGSPCQGFSFAGKGLAFDDPRSKLFFEYVRILSECRKINPNIKFLLENVKMKKDYLKIISKCLEVEPVCINSALVSAQDRTRYYWANWKIDQPEDKGITTLDIIDSQDLSVNSDSFMKWWESKETFMISKKHSCYMNLCDKAICCTARQVGSWNGNLVKHDKGIRFISPLEAERLQTVPDGYTKCVSNAQRYKALGNGWTVDVIAHIFRQSVINDHMATASNMVTSILR